MKKKYYFIIMIISFFFNTGCDGTAFDLTEEVNSSFKIFAIGGYDGVGDLSTVEEYNPDTNTWSSKASMPTARAGLAVAEVDGMIYAIGGDDGTVEVYNPATNTWSSKRLCRLEDFALLL